MAWAVCSSVMLLLMLHGHGSSACGLSGLGESWSLPHGACLLIRESNNLDACAVVVVAGGRMIQLHGVPDSTRVLGM